MIARIAQVSLILGISLVSTQASSKGAKDSEPPVRTVQLRKQPPAQKPNPAFIKKFDGECKVGKFLACYLLATYFAFNLDDEASSIPYFRSSCEGGMAIGCFNQGTYLMKNRSKKTNLPVLDREARKEALAAIEKACSFMRKRQSLDLNLLNAGEFIYSTEQLEGFSCKMADVLRNNLMLDYDPLMGLISEKVFRVKVAKAPNKKGN